MKFENKNECFDYLLNFFDKNQIFFDKKTLDLFIFNIYSAEYIYNFNLNDKYIKCYIIQRKINPNEKNLCGALLIDDIDLDHKNINSIIKRINSIEFISKNNKKDIEKIDECEIIRDDSKCS